MTFHTNRIHVSCPACGRRTSKTNSRAHHERCPDRAFRSKEPGFYRAPVTDLHGEFVGFSLHRIDVDGTIWWCFYAEHRNRSTAARMISRQLTDKGRTHFKGEITSATATGA